MSVMEWKVICVTSQKPLINPCETPIFNSAQPHNHTLQEAGSPDPFEQSSSACCCLSLGLREAKATCNSDFCMAWQGRLSFDNFGYAVLNVLQTMTLESWTDAQMFYFIDAVGNYAIAFFVVVVLVGGFFGLNLLVAVITAKFAQAQSSMVRT